MCLRRYVLLLLLVPMVAAAAPRQTLAPEVLSPLPSRLCEFAFKDVRDWRSVGDRVVEPGCADADVPLRFLDGKTWRWRVVEEVDTDPPETLSRDPRPRAALALRKGSLDDADIEVPLPDSAGASVRHADGAWTVVAAQGESEASVVAQGQRRVLIGNAPLPASYDSGRYCCSVDEPFYILDDGHGHLLFLGGDPHLLQRLMDLPERTD